MPGTVYTVASGKGGVGKTTTSVNLAVALWREGNAVALVDADIGMANLAAVLDLEPEESLHDVLAGRATVEDAVVEAKDGDLMVLPGSRSLDSFADADPNALYAAVETLAGRADYVIVDTGAGLSYEDVLPLGMADGVILVTTPDPAAFGDTMKTMEIADLLGAPIRGLVVTRAAADTDSEAIAAEIGAELLGTVPEDPSVMASTVAGDPLESHAPDSEAAAAYRALADALLSGDEEWLEEHARERIGVGEPAPESVATTGDDVPDVTGPVDEADERDADEETDADEAPPPTGAPVDADEDPGGPPVPESEADDLGEGNEEPPADEDVVDEEPPDEGAQDEDGSGVEEDEPGVEEEGEPSVEGDDLDADEDAPEPTDGADSAEDDGSAPVETAVSDDSEREAGSDPDLEPREPADIEDEPETARTVDEPEEEGAADEETAAVGGEEGDDVHGDDAEGDEGTDDATVETEGEEIEEDEPGDEEEGGEEADDADEDDGTHEDDDVGEDDEEDERSDDAAAEEKRGGFFGWLGRLFS